MFLATTFLLVTLVLYFFQQVVEQSTGTAEVIATTIAGVVAPLLAQGIKRLFGASGIGALAVTIVVSAATAIGALWYAGEIHSFGDVIKQVSAVFGIATVVYKLYLTATDQKM